MSLQQIGIPISEEQCIGDSLSIINNSFLNLDTRSTQISNAIVLSADKISADINNLQQADNILTTNLNLTSSFLSSSLSLTSSNLLLSALNLKTSVTELSGRVIIVNQPFFVVDESHTNSTVVLTAATQTSITVKPNTNFTANHKTTILQLGIGQGQFSNDFVVNPSYLLYTLEKYTTCTLYKPSSQTPWIITGQLSAAPKPTPEPPEIFQFSLQGPLAENFDQATEITGVNGDVLYFNARPLAESTNETMSIKVNGTKRMTIAFTSDRLGTHFGYRANGSNVIVSDLFSKGEKSLGIADSNIVLINSTVAETTTPPIGFAYSLTGDREDSSNNVALFTAGQADVLYYNKETVNQTSKRNVVVNIFVNNAWRSTVVVNSNRIGTSFGYKIASQTEVLYGTFTIDSPYSGSYSKIYLTLSGWTPPTISTITEYSNTIKGPQTYNNTNVIAISAYGFPDSLLVENRTSTTSTILSTMTVNVNGNDRLSIEFTEDRKDLIFQYKMAGYNELLTGKFAAGKVYLGSGSLPLVTTSLYNPYNNKLSPGNDSVNQINFTSSVGNSFCFYNNISPVQETSTSTLYASGDTVNNLGTIMFNNGFLNSTFGISLSTDNIKQQAPFAFGTFNGGNIQLVFILTGNQTDPFNKISMLNYTNSAKLFYKKRPSTNSVTGTTSHIYINNKYLATVTYLLDYNNETFQFTPYEGGTMYNGTFTTGKIFLT